MFNKQLNSTSIHSYVAILLACTNILFFVFINLDRNLARCLHLKLIHADSKRDRLLFLLSANALTISNGLFVTTTKMDVVFLPGYCTILYS